MPVGIVIIVGAGTLGRAAAQGFVGIGAQVIVLDIDVRKLRMVDAMFGGKVSTMMANEYNLNRVVGFADVLVGAVLLPGERAPMLIKREMVRRMRRGSVVMDFSIDHGGCVETSRPMTLRDPTFVAEGVTHFCVPNLPAAVARDRQSRPDQRRVAVHPRDRRLRCGVRAVEAPRAPQGHQNVSRQGQPATG